MHRQLPHHPFTHNLQRSRSRKIQFAVLQGCQRAAGILAELTGQRQPLDDSRYSIEIVKLTKGCKGGQRN